MEGAASGWLSSCRPRHRSRAAVRSKKARSRRTYSPALLGLTVSNSRIRSTTVFNHRVSTANWGSSQLRSVDDSYLWSSSQWDGFPGDSYKILGIDPADWTLGFLSAPGSYSYVQTSKRSFARTPVASTS